MEAYVITMANNEVSLKGFKNLEASSRKVNNSFNINKFDAIVPGMVKAITLGNGLKWNYPWSGSQSDIKSGLVKSAYATSNPETRIACALSHWLLWNKCIKEYTPLLILEHDSFFLHKLDFPLMHW